MIKKRSYWEKRYATGGNSGQGSRGVHREWKWKIINETVGPRLDSIVDVGCGDLQFWEERDCSEYVGVDLSRTIIDANQKHRPNWGFVNGNATTRYPLKGRAVLCMDMLFHIMDDGDFDRILENLKSYAEEWLIIYTWDVNPFAPNTTDGKYQKYRSLPTERFTDFVLVRHEKEPFDDYGAIYIFRKMGLEISATRS